MKTNCRLVKEAYPVLLWGALMMTWAFTTYGFAPGHDLEARRFQKEWTLSPNQYSVVPACKIESRMPASDQVCTDKTKENNKPIPQLQVHDKDLSWIALRIKKWKKKNGDGGML